MPETKKLIAPKYAFSFIFRFFLIVLTGFIVSGLLLVIFLNREIGPTYLQGISNLSQLQALLPSILFITAFVQALTLCVIVILLALLWSHGVSGPLVRFRKYLRDMAEGKSFPERIAFRDTDQLAGLAHAFSEMALSQKERTIRTLSLLAQAQKIIDECLALKIQGEVATPEYKQKLSGLAMVYLRVKEVYAPGETI